MYEDSHIWEALEKVQLTSLGMEPGTFGVEQKVIESLEMVLEEGGKNFSQGVLHTQLIPREQVELTQGDSHFVGQAKDNFWL